ncbi:hypothetical protein CLI64_01825 [Nostoc sp. CENA543]|uniref:hypothetical protein n=1 Tax=Nostoc sp. CENA543 TaxID=1869241 RepID=UPI000CA3C41B|nr:hypothetical protein [Nostoc sp. CENA543]AUS99231.1 hypothetical protein CLI64_01825 [Nostoc sp. CENA543]
MLRDLDSAYQERLQEIAIKERQFAELQLKYQEVLQKLEVYQEQFRLEIDKIYQENLANIEIKNQQFSILESNYQTALQELDNQKKLIQEYVGYQNNNKNNFLINDEEYEILSKSGLFIVGNARSGTSILCDCLNLSPDVFLLGEANLYLHYNLDNFVEFFNTQHIQFKNRRCKGTFIPSSRLPEKGGFAFLSRMHKNYKFVGEKIAFGPHGDFNNQSRQELFFHFHATYFYFSNYILIMRRPTEAIWSMLKMFPDRKLYLLFESWLRTIQIQIDVFHSFPNSYVIFFENMNNEKVLNLCSLMGINLHIPEAMFRENNKYSLLARNEIPNELSPYADTLLAYEDIYQKIQDEFDPKTFKLKETASNYGCARYGFSSSIQEKIEVLLHDLAHF